MKAKTYKPTFLICPSCENETDINVTEAIRNKHMHFTQACDCCDKSFEIIIESEDDVEMKPNGRIIRSWNLLYAPAMMEHPFFLVAENAVTITPGASETPFAVESAISSSFMHMPAERPRLLKKIVGMHALRDGPLIHERSINDRSDLIMGSNGYLDVPTTFPEVRDQLTLLQSTGIGLPNVKH